MDKLRIILLEDNLADAELLEYSLRAGGLAFTSVRVETESAFMQALDEFNPDIVLVDYQLPSYSGRAAIDHLRQTHPDIPAIVVTGSIGELMAVELLKAGAQDYILKDHLMRLPAAIGTALQVREEIRLRHKSEQRLRESEAMLRKAQAIAHVGSWYSNLAGTNAAWSDEMFRIFGYAPGAFTPDTEVFLQSLLLPDDRKRVLAAIATILETRTEGKCEFRIRRPDGDIRHVLWQAELALDDGGDASGLIGIVMDITERVQAEEKIRNLAFFDVLTQLPNRRLLLDRLWQTMVSSRRGGYFGALMFIDLDNFKLLNDLHGHETGDMLLVETARRISGCLRAMDTVARYGGDEFVVMLSELAFDRKVSIARAGIVAKKIRSLLDEPYVLGRTHPDAGDRIAVEYRCTASIGVALFQGHEPGPEDILRSADMAMYQAKSEGRNQVRFSGPLIGAADGGTPAAACTAGAATR